MNGSQKTSPAHPPNDDAMIDRLLEWEESDHFECKRLIGKLASALETIVAFANSDGGHLVLGLDDPAKAKGRARVYGVEENPMALDELRRIVESRITPALSGVSWTRIGCALNDGQQGSVIVV